jgi:hypothetical protein
MRKEGACFGFWKPTPLSKRSTVTELCIRKTLRSCRQWYPWYPWYRWAVAVFVSGLPECAEGVTVQHRSRGCWGWWGRVGPTSWLSAGSLIPLRRWSLCLAYSTATGSLLPREDRCSPRGSYWRSTDGCPSLWPVCPRYDSQGQSVLGVSVAYRNCLWVRAVGL